MAHAAFHDHTPDPYATVRSTNSQRHGHKSIGPQGVFAPLGAREPSPSSRPAPGDLDEALSKRRLQQASAQGTTSALDANCSPPGPSSLEASDPQEAPAHHRWSSWTGTTAIHSHSGSDHEDTDHERSGISLDEEYMSSSIGGSRRPSTDSFGAEYANQSCADGDESRTSEESARSMGASKRRRRNSGSDAYMKVEVSDHSAFKPPDATEADGDDDDEAALDAAVESTTRALEQATALLQSTLLAQQDLVRLRATQETLADSMKVHEASLVRQLARTRDARDLVVKATADVGALIPASKRTALASTSSAPRPTHWRLPSFGAAPAIAPPTHSRNESAGASWLEAKDVDATIGKSAARRLEKALSASAAAAAATAAAAAPATHDEVASSAARCESEAEHANSSLPARLPSMSMPHSRTPSVSSISAKEAPVASAFVEASPALMSHRRTSSNNVSAAAATLAAVNGGQASASQSAVYTINTQQAVRDKLATVLQASVPVAADQSGAHGAVAETIKRNRVPKRANLRLASMPSTLAPAITSSASSAEHSPLSPPSPSTSASFGSGVAHANGQIAPSGVKSPGGYFNPYLRKSRDRGDRTGSRASLASLGSLASIDERLASPSPTDLSRPTSALGLASAVITRASSSDAQVDTAALALPTSRATLTPAMAALSANAVGRRALSGASSSSSNSMSSQATLMPARQLRVANSPQSCANTDLEAAWETGFDGVLDTSTRPGFDFETDGEASMTHLDQLHPFSMQRDARGLPSPGADHRALGVPHRSPRLSRAKGRAQHSASSSFSESAHGWLSAGLHGSSSDSEDATDEEQSHRVRSGERTARGGHARRKSEAGPRGALAALRKLNGIAPAQGSAATPATDDHAARVVQGESDTSPMVEAGNPATAALSQPSSAAAQCESDTSNTGWRGSLTSWMRSGSATPA